MSYTYMVGWIELNKFYYGVRIAHQKSPKEDLWKEYFTSSKIVEQYRFEFGDPDFIKIDKIFDNDQEAREYEMKYIRENNLHKDDNFLNRACWPVAFGPRSEQTKNNISKGKKLKGPSVKHIQNITQIGKNNKGRIPWNKGKTEDPLITKKRSEKLSGRKMTAESSLKKSAKLKGRKSPNVGNSYKMTPEQIAKRQETRKQNAIKAGRTY